MQWCKKDVTPLLTHWSYVFLALTHRCMLSTTRLVTLTHWGRVTHICVRNLISIGSHNGLSPDRRHAIIWTNAGILLIRTLATNFSEILGKIHSFSFKKMHMKMSSAKWRLFSLGLNELIQHHQQSCSSGRCQDKFRFYWQGSYCHADVWLDGMVGIVWVWFSVVLISFSFARVKQHGCVYVMYVKCLCNYVTYVAWFQRYGVRDL